MPNVVRAIVVLAVVARHVLALATTAVDVCGDPIPDPCIVTSTIAVDGGSTLDLGDADLVVRTLSGRLDVGTGTMAILARNVTLEAGGRLLGAGGGIVVDATGPAGRISIGDGSRIDVSAPAGGGRIVLLAPGDIVAAGDVLANGTTIPALGGAIFVNAGGSVLLHDVAASGGSHAFAPGFPARGFVIVNAGGAVTIEGTADVSHGDCLNCAINVTAEGDITLDRVDVHATGDPGDGGHIDLDARGSVVLNGDLVAQGHGGDPDVGGDGGEVLIAARQDVRLNHAIVAHGTTPDADGGTIDVDAGRDIIQAAGSVIDTDGGGEGCGASDDHFDAGRDLRLGTLTLNGNECGGGSLDASAQRDLIIADLVAANASADGVAGDVSIDAGRNLDVLAPLRANGGSAGGGGSIDLEACRVIVAAGVPVETQGPEGDTVLKAHDAMTIAGRLESGGSNTVRFGDPAAPPVITGVVNPPATPELDASLGHCGPPAVCGDGTIEGREECDDGNADGCDGCSAGCQREECGNRRIDCDETCDPPDGVRCDPTCQTIPLSTVRVPGSLRAVGCQVEWELVLPEPSLYSRSGVPKRVQSCVDGDPRCDVDAVSDGTCSFSARACLRAVDPRLPKCTPAPLAYVAVVSPKPLAPGDATDQVNATTLVTALGDLGLPVKAGSTVLVDGIPDAQSDHCTASLVLQVPHAGKVARRTFAVGSQDTVGHRLRSNVVKLDCRPNAAVCGDGVVGVGELCDDGNAQACDGCSPTCRPEGCGNEVLDCAEECDLGLANGTPGAACTATCTTPPPALRIPAGRGQGDCALEFALALDPAGVAADRRGLPKNKQVCTDGDPACDFDPRTGWCRLHLFACVAGADPRISCPAARVTEVYVLKPPLPGNQAHDALGAGIAGIGLPRGPGEACSQAIPIDLRAGERLRLKFRAGVDGARPDSDALKLSCLAPAG